MYFHPPSKGRHRSQWSTDPRSNMAEFRDALIYRRSKRLRLPPESECARANCACGPTASVDDSVTLSICSSHTTRCTRATRHAVGFLGSRTGAPQELPSLCPNSVQKSTDGRFQFYFVSKPQAASPDCREVQLHLQRHMRAANTRKHKIGQ
jgi:hypothetical protein